MTSQPRGSHERVKRPLRRARLLVEVELLTAADFDSDEALAGALSRLAVAGLHGLVVYVARVELDGNSFHVDRQLSGDVLRSLRPRPDARIRRAALEVEAALRSINAVLGDAPAAADEVEGAS